ncbi:hypothetical protein DRO42_07030 [Candidatus Bathyarchaeota archaeon]|nr:MAG: hypothetical protein DRO42_07030 [Candidatus Bathyarchaeota archaeon]
MSETPYDPRLITPKVYGDRRPVAGEVVALLHVTFERRGLKLIEARSRALLLNEIHELMITDEEDAAPGGGADRVSAIAFFEIKRGGIVVVGDEVSIGGKVLGTLAGFDLTHMPNHMNILVKTESLEAPAMRVGDPITFRRAP